MNRKDFRFLDRLRVRWAEIDAQKIVFNGHYLLYFDTAVAGYWRALALPYASTMEALGGDLYVRKATVDYLGSAHYDDLLEVGIRCARIGNSSIVFDAAVFRQDRLLVTGELVYVFADPSTQGSRPVPQALRDVLLGFEACESMLEVRIGKWSELGSAAQVIRRTVFVEEQKVPLAMEHDSADFTALHALAVNRLGLAVATGRLVEAAAGPGRIGRVAVHQALRGGGIGRSVLDALLRAARERGIGEVVLSAQATASAFYRDAGFVAHGDEFKEAGVPHMEMTRRL